MSDDTAVVGRCRQSEGPPDLVAAYEAGLAQAADGLDPAKALLDALADLLAPAVAGVAGGSSVEAKKLGMVSVEERRVTGFRNDTNVVRIVSAEWTAWLP